MAKQAKKKSGFSLLDYLGSGMLDSAAKALKGRKAKVEREIRQAVSGSMRKPKKPKQ
jgi:hypothetical protein